MDALNWHSIICKVNSHSQQGSHCPQSCCTVRVKGSPSHHIPCLRDFPCLALQTRAAAERAALRRGGRGREGVTGQQTSSLFYIECGTSVVGPSATITGGWQVRSVHGRSQKVPAAVATRMFLALSSHWQNLGFACSRHSFSPRDCCLDPSSSGFYSHFSCQSGIRYLWIHRVQIHDIWEMFTGDQERELLRPKLFLFCPPSSPSHSFCSYFYAKIT